MLHGRRVTLRASRREDLPRQWEFNNDVEVELLGGGDPPEPQSLERLEGQFQERLQRGDRNGPSFAIEADGLYIGGCGMFNIDSTSRTCEVGIGIGDRRYWGKGYGREAMGLLLDYAFRLRNMHKVWLTVNGDNERAIRSYRACGFVEEGRQREHVWNNGRYIDLVSMGILSDEWTDITTRA